MSTDVLSRIRAADPCPSPVAYDENGAQSNIDAIVRADLTVGGDVVPLRRPRRPRRRAWAAVAAVAVVVAVAGTVVGLETSRDRAPLAGAHTSSAPAASAPGVAPTVPGPGSSPPWSTFSKDGVSFEYPHRWVSYPLVTPMATVAEVVTYLSTVPVASTCSTTGGGGSSCHSPSPSLLDGGVFVSWIVTFIPGQKLPADGEDTTIAGHPAKITRGDVRDCPMGAVDAVTASIAEDEPGAPDGLIQNIVHMNACFGSGEDTAADRAAVDRMLASLRIAP